MFEKKKLFGNEGPNDFYIDQVVLQGNENV